MAATAGLGLVLGAVADHFGIADKAKEVANNAVDTIEAGVNQMVETASEAVQAIDEAVNNTVEVVGEAVNNVANNVTSFLGGLFGGG
ncbi:MAG: hypothetical protein GTO14_26030 [Anaerolineales bacterium]|nr:hypothetical protein [Anaerolineales bacterium]